MTFSLVLMLAPTNAVFLANVSYAQLLGSTTLSSPQTSSQTASTTTPFSLIETMPSNNNDNNNLNGNNNNNNKAVIINFDDGYKSHFLYAKPILDKYGFKASFFIVCGKMETQPKWMNWQDIMALKDDGMDIESHTMTHAHLK